jgi:integration host factor subunit beta
MKDKITYALLQDRVVRAAGVSRKEVHSLLKEMAARVGSGLAVDGKVNLAGLGRFSLKVQSARPGRNPRTGEAIDIPEKNRVHFLPEAPLRRHINRKYEQMPTEPAPQPETPAVPVAASTSQSADIQDRQAGLDHTAAVVPQVVPPATAKPLPSPAAADPPKDIPVIPPGNETSGRRKNPAVPAVILVLLLAAAAFFLWPRPRTPMPPITPWPVPMVAKADVSAVPLPPESPQPESARPVPTVVAAATTALEPAPAPVTVEAPVASPVSTGPAPLSVYAVTTGDSLWKISDDVYKYAYFWPILFRENQVILKHPDTLKIGMRLEIPVFEGQVGRLTESNFQQLADGYFQVYQVYRRHNQPMALYYLWVAYQLQAYWVPVDELMAVEPDDLKFIRQLKGRGLIR